MRTISLFILSFMSTFSHAAPGVIPAVSNHLQIKPAYYHFDQLPAEQVIPGMSRRFIMGTQSSLTRWDMKAGTKTPLHFHVNEQITRVEDGELIINSQGTQYHLHPGDTMIFPPNVPHQFSAVKNTIVYEFHTPGRQDFINGEFDKSIKMSKR